MRRGRDLVKVAAGLAVLGATFLTLMLGRWDAFIYRPGSHVSDLTITFWPNLTYIKQSLDLHRALPMWRTSMFAGSPLDADPQSGLWYLPNLLVLALPATVGINLLVLLHFVAAGVGMWLWSRATGTSRSGACVASLGYALTPRVFAHLGFGHLGLVYASSYIPWIMWGTEAITRGSRKQIGVIGLALGMQLVVHPQLAFYTASSALVYGLALLAWRRKKAFLGSRTLIDAAAGGLAAILALGVAAAQLLPLLQLAPLSGRAQLDVPGAAVASLAPSALWGLVRADYGGFADSMIYVGLPVLILAGLGVGRRQARFWWGFSLIAMLYAMGPEGRIYSWVSDLLPLQDWLRAPSRIWFVVAAGLTLMAGWGTDRVFLRLPTDNRILKYLLFGISCLALFLTLGFLVVFGLPPANMIFFTVLAMGFSAVVVLIVNDRLPRVWGLIMILGLVSMDLLVLNASLIEGRSQDQVLMDGELGAYLDARSHFPPNRSYSPSYSLTRPAAGYYGLETADGVDPLFLTDYDAFMELASGVERHAYGVTIPAMEGNVPVAEVNRNAIPNPMLLGLLNVRYVAAEYPLTVEGLTYVTRLGRTHLYENDLYLPRAFVVGQATSVDDLSQALTWLEDHSVAQSAVVEKGADLDSGDVEWDVQWDRYSPDGIALTVEIDRSGLLVVSQAWYPGWRAEVDGLSAQLYRVDGILTGVYLEAGQHRVALSYRPRTLLWGVGISAASLALSIFLLYWRRR